MKYFTLIVFVVCLQYTAISQELDYELYYKACFEAEYNVALNKKDEAWKQYNQTFKFFFPLIQNLNKAIDLGEELAKENKQIQIELSQLIEFKNIFFADNSIVREIKNEEQKKKLIKVFPYLNENDFAPLTSQKLENVLKLSNFLYLDQSVRKIKNISCKDSLLATVDEKIYTDFLPYIKTYGYPSQRDYGMFAMYPVFLFLHSSMRYGVTDELKKILFEQVKKGNYHPSSYARLIDRYRSWITKEPQLYGEWIENGKIGPIYDIKNIDVRRSEIGIEPYYEFCLKNQYQLPEDYILPEKYKL